MAKCGDVEAAEFLALYKEIKAADPNAARLVLEILRKLSSKRRVRRNLT